MKITIFGAGYVGLTCAACLADLGHEVICFDINKEQIAKLKQGALPFFEPDLGPLVNKNLSRGKLKFTDDENEAVDFGSIIFNCVGTPSTDGGEADLSAVFAVAETVAKNSGNDKILVNKSTVPPGTARRIHEMVEKNKKGTVNIEIVSNPEFLREGSAVRAFNYPDKIVIGADSDKALQTMRKVYSGRLRTYLPIVETNWETAELIKYANNTFLATKISFINEMANICDITGADIKLVSLALGLDYRISPRFLNAGVGYGGSCFPKDVKALAYTAAKHGYSAKLVEEVTAVNERQKKIIIKKIITAFNQDIRGRTFCILGLSFKPKTSDMREAPSITIIGELLALGANVRAFDPAAVEEAKKIFGSRISYLASAEEAAEGSDAIILATEWDEFRSLDLPGLRKKMKGNKLFDGRNIYEPELVKEEGFDYFGIGRR